MEEKAMASQKITQTPSRFSLGVEEEFQTVDRETGLLTPYVHTALEKGGESFGEQIKPEMLQGMVEIITDVCPRIDDLRIELLRLRTMLARLAAQDGVALISAGTHPQSHWRDQPRARHPRYEELEEEYQDVGRSIMICGLHIHVGIDHHEITIPLMNQLRTWIPHLLALSSNSPFWINRYTGIKSYRTIVWKRFPRSGVPPLFSSTAEYDRYIETLVQNNFIDNGKRIWWDIRPHPFFSTIEFRVCDMPATFNDTIAIAALCQALVAKLTLLYESNLTTTVFPSHYIEENKWRAARYGLDAEFVDFAQNKTKPMRESLHELFNFVDDMVDELGTRQELDYLRSLIDNPEGTGADRQIAVYSNSNNVDEVTHFLMQQTLQGMNLDLDSLLPKLA
jgi:glutamate---cysteine ligase / carboxylate-amine ligase